MAQESYLAHDLAESTNISDSRDPSSIPDHTGDRYVTLDEVEDIINAGVQQWFEQGSFKAITIEQIKDLDTINP